MNQKIWKKNKIFVLPKYIENIYISDHLFDQQPSKYKRKQKALTKWWEPPKGVPGIRKYYKLNEMSFTLSERMGFTEVDSNFK